MACNDKETYAEWLRGQPHILDAKVDPATGDLVIMFRGYVDEIEVDVGFAQRLHVSPRME